MTITSHGVPWHGNGTASVCVRLAVLQDNPSVGRVWDNTSTGPYEVICPGLRG
jgi:hypothetical protein